MKFKKLSKSIASLGILSTVSLISTVSLTTNDIIEIKPFKLSQDDIKFYSNLYTGKDGIFDKLNIIERREQLLNERKLRKFIPSIGIIEIGKPKVFDKMMKTGTKEELVYNNSVYNDNFDHHSTLVASLAATRSGVNPFANIYSSALHRSFSYYDLEQTLKAFQKKGVSVVNMSIGQSFNINRDIVSKVFDYIKDVHVDFVFNTKKINFRKITIEDVAEYFEKTITVEANHNFDIGIIATNKDKYLTSAGVHVMLSSLSKALSEVSQEYQKLNQLYSSWSRLFDTFALKYNMKFFVSAGNLQETASTTAKYYDDLSSLGYRPQAFYEKFKFQIRQDTWKLGRNIFYIGALENTTHKTVPYSTIGTNYNEDYPFVSAFVGFSGFYNKYNSSKNVHPYIRSYNNNYSYKNPLGLGSFTLFHGTSFTAPLVAGMVSLLEYDLQRVITPSELKTALALSSVKSSAYESANADKTNNYDHEQKTRNGAFHRSGFGYPLYNKLREFFIKRNQKTKNKFRAINNGNSTKYAFSKVVIPPNKTLKVALSWDYISNLRYDNFADDVSWEDNNNKLKFGRYIDALKIVLKDNYGKIIQDEYDNFSNPIYSTVRTITFKNTTNRNKVLSIGIKVISKNDNVVKINNDGDFSIGYTIE